MKLFTAEDMASRIREVFLDRIGEINDQRRNMYQRAGQHCTTFDQKYDSHSREKPYNQSNGIRVLSPFVKDFYKWVAKKEHFQTIGSFKYIGIERKSNLRTMQYNRGKAFIGIKTLPEVNPKYKPGGTYKHSTRRLYDKWRERCMYNDTVGYKNDVLERVLEHMEILAKEFGKLRDEWSYESFCRERLIKRRLKKFGKKINITPFRMMNDANIIQESFQKAV